MNNTAVTTTERHQQQTGCPERVTCSPTEAAGMLGIARSTLYAQFLDTGILPSKKRGGRRLIYVPDLHEFAKWGRVERGDHPDTLGKPSASDLGAFMPDYTAVHGPHAN